MKTPLHLLRRNEGSLMVFALLIVVVGAIVLAGWAQLLATRARFAEAADDGAARRITLENARAIARQYILTNMPSGKIPYFTTNFANGTITISGATNDFFGSTKALPSTNSDADNNPFSPMERIGYYTTFLGHLTDGVTSYNWTFRIRTRSPIAAGFGYVLHTGSSFSNTAYLPSSYIDYRSGSNGANIVGTYSNFPQIPMTSYTNGSASNYYGYFQIPAMTNTNVGTGTFYDGTASASYFCVTNMLKNVINGVTNNVYAITNIQSNSVELILDPTNASTVLRYKIPTDISTNTNTNINTLCITGGYALTNSTNTNTNFRYTNSTHSVVAVRIQSSAGTNTLHIIATNGDNLTNIVLGGTNNTRRIYLNRASGNTTLNLTTTNTNNASWRLAVTLSNTPLAISYANSRTLTIIGGIRSNAQIRRGVIGDWMISAETNAANMEDVADRIMWLEDYPTLPQ